MWAAKAPIERDRERPQWRETEKYGKRERQEDKAVTPSPAMNHVTENPPLDKAYHMQCNAMQCNAPTQSLPIYHAALPHPHTIPTSSL